VFFIPKTIVLQKKKVFAGLEAFFVQKNGPGYKSQGGQKSPEGAKTSPGGICPPTSRAYGKYDTVRSNFKPKVRYVGAVRRRWKIYISTLSWYGKRLTLQGTGTLYVRFFTQNSGKVGFALFYFYKGKGRYGSLQKLN